MNTLTEYKYYGAYGHENDPDSTALQLLCTRHNHKLLPAKIRLLLAAGADPCVGAEEGRTPLQLLTSEEPKDKAAALLEGALAKKQAAAGENKKEGENKEEEGEDVKEPEQKKAKSN